MSNTKLRWSQTESEDSSQSFLVFEGEPPDFKLDKGMAGCRQCGAVILIANNVVPASFVESHKGHLIYVRLADGQMTPRDRELW